MTDAVIEFAKWVIQESVFDGCDLDGGTVQEKALELGLLTKTSYDPEKHGEDEYAEPGSDWYVFSNLLTDPALSPEPEDQQEPVAWVSEQSLDNLHKAGRHVAVRTAIHKKPLKSGNGVALYTRPSEQAVTEAEIQRLTTEIARKHGCDRGTFTVCWGKVEKGLPCRCEDEARHALTALGAQTPPEGVVTEAMVEIAAKAVVAEWQKMVAETSPHMSPGDHARAFVSPGNHRLIRAALKAAM